MKKAPTKVKEARRPSLYYLDTSTISFYVADQAAGDPLKEEMRSHAREFMRISKMVGAKLVTSKIADEEIVQEGTRGGRKKHRATRAVYSLKHVPVRAEDKRIAQETIGSAHVNYIDYLHYAVAAHCGTRAVITWNKKDFVEARRDMKIKCLAEGWCAPEVFTPQEAVVILASGNPRRKKLRRVSPYWWYASPTFQQYRREIKKARIRISKAGTFK